MKTSPYTLFTDRNIPADEFDALMSATGWGNDGFFTKDVLARHFEKISYMAYMRDDAGRLVGYASAIYNGFASNIIDTMAIHPDASQEEVGQILLQEIARQSHGFPIYAMPFMDQQDIFKKEGFFIPGRPMQALAKKNQDKAPLQPALI